MSTDVLHSRGESLEWSESFYFNLYDRENDICMFMRIGLKPNADERSAFCFIMMPDGSALGMKGATTMGKGDLEALGLTFRKIEDERKWSLCLDGHLSTMTAEGPRAVRASFDLVFETLNEVFDYRECVDLKGERLSRSVASEHLEQFGRVTGTVKVGDRTFTIDGLGERDHSWGVRDWNAPKMWIWLTAQFSPQVALNVTKLFVEGGEVTAGFIHLNGRSIPLVKAEVRTELDPNGSPRSLDMVLEDRQGISYRVTAEVLRGVQLPFPGRDGKSVSVMHETLAEYEFDGQKGYGIAEYLVRRD
jgi:hypothetical protein